MTNWWTDKSVFVTGGHGFLGRHVVRLLRMLSPREIFAPSREQLDLLNDDAVDTFLSEQKPDIVIHLAASCGGIGANRIAPADFFYENMKMGLGLIDSSSLNGVGKFVCIGTVCAYPRLTPTPFKESDLWNGYPEETNAPYGIAKKALLVQLQAYRRQYDLNGAYLLPVNLYGPEDDFDPATSHVIPAMIAKFHEAIKKKKRAITLWGSGSATREFLYVEDCAKAILLAAEKYNSPEPLNLGSGEEISIKDLAERISGIMGYKEAIEWDVSKPDGQPKRLLDSSRARALLGWRAEIPLNLGLQRTIDWYWPS